MYLDKTKKNLQSRTRPVKGGGTKPPHGPVRGAPSPFTGRGRGRLAAYIVRRVRGTPKLFCPPSRVNLKFISNNLNIIYVYKQCFSGKS